MLLNKCFIQWCWFNVTTKALYINATISSNFGTFFVGTHHDERASSLLKPDFCQNFCKILQISLPKDIFAVWFFIGNKEQTWKTFSINKMWKKKWKNEKKCGHKIFAFCYNFLVACLNNIKSMDGKPRKLKKIV